jgi:hypothetical protein
LGLASLLVYSIISGISFSFAFRIISDTSEGGFETSIMKQITNSNPSVEALMLVIFFVLSIYSIYRLANFFGKVYEQRIVGIATVTLGYSGSFLIVYGSQNPSYFIFLGIGAWILGGVIVTANRMNDKNRKKYS